MTDERIEAVMDDSTLGELNKLKDKNLKELQEQFELIFGKKTDSTNDTFLTRKIAYRLQERELGGLSRKAKSKIAELIEKYDPVNNKTLRPKMTTGGKEFRNMPSMRDKRLPIPGTTIRKKYKGKDIEVRVLEKGFEYNGKFYRSLSGIVRLITGSNWNGFDFFDV